MHSLLVNRSLCTDYVQDTSLLISLAPKSRKRDKEVGCPSSLTPPVPKSKKRDNEVGHPPSLTPPVPKARARCKEVEHLSLLTSQLGIVMPLVLLYTLDQALDIKDEVIFIQLLSILISYLL